MIDPQKYYETLKKSGIDFFTGVPDSSLKSFTALITDCSEEGEHIVAANEGSAIAMGIGKYLATGKIPFIYMQNSGLGNAVNPLLSLADEMVYKIPMLIMVGWRGEPGKKDEPQHKKQGLVTLTMLEAMQIPYHILDENEERALDQIELATLIAQKNSKPFVLIARPSLFKEYKSNKEKTRSFELVREEALKVVVDHLTDEDIVISTTGKLSRELFEYREELQQNHNKDFLTVGGMGYSSSIALGIALAEKNRRIFCLDGDGAMLMHTGALSNIGHLSPQNYFHIVFNNGAHESVGGQPTLGFEVDFLQIAKAFNYKTTIRAESHRELCQALNSIKSLHGPILLEIRVDINSRKNLGRPTIQPAENKIHFMNNLQQ